MTNKKSTKRALLCSALSLLLCFSMLVGTTFAWFTDSVSSANNVIQSGNLDIELYYQNSATTNNWTDTGDNSWKKLDENTNVFLSQLWEPGHTEVVKLKIVNEGSLDLKYQLGINVVSEVTSTNILGGELKLSDHIKFGVVEGDQSYNRENAVNAVASTATAINAGYAKASTLKAKNDANANDEAIITMVVYMPETVGNDANAAKDAAVPTINLGIKLEATQVEGELDSFDDKYDAGAYLSIVNTAAELTSALENGESVKLGSDITVDETIVVGTRTTSTLSTNSSIAPAPATIIDLNGKTITGTKGRDAEGNRIHVIVNNGNLVLMNGTVKSSGYDGGSAIYNAEGANLTISDMVVYGAPLSSTTPPVEKWPSYSINNYGYMTVNGATVKAYHGGIASCGNGEAIINNADIDIGQNTSTGITSWALYTCDNGKMTVNGGIFKNTKQDVSVFGGGYLAEGGSEAIIVNGGTFVGGGFSTGADREYVIKGGTFDVDPSAYVADGYHALQAGDKYQVVPESVDAIVSDNAELAAALQNATTDEIILAAGEFTADIYNITARDTLIITGQGADTKLAFSNQQVRPSQFKNLTIENCTIERMPNKNWGHLVYASSDNASGVYTISNCIFNGVGSQGIFINENVSGATYNIVDCVFNGDFGSEGAITIQNNADVNVNVNVNGCTFNNIPETSNEIFVHYENKGLNLTVDDKVTVANATMLADAISKGATEIYLMDGNFTLPNANNKNVTLIGVGTETIVDYSHMGGYQEVSGSSFNFKNMTLNVGNTWEKGLQHTVKVTYEDCHIIGWQSVYANEVEFTNCTLDSNGGEHCVWTYSADKITFKECDFTYTDRAVNCFGYEADDVVVTFTECTFTKVAGKDTTGAIETNSSNMNSLTLTINDCSVNEGELWFIAGWDSLSGARTTATVDGSADEGVVLVQSGVLPYLTLNSNSTYMLTGDFGGNNVALTMPAGVENVIFDGSKATNINELIIVQNGKIIDNANDPIGERSGNVTVQNFNVLSQINVFACKTEVVVQNNTAEALMIHAGNCDVKVLNNTIDANFESHPTYRDANNTWNTNNYGIALNIFDYNLWLDGNTVTDAIGHAIGINGWEGTIDNGDENVIESFKGNTITVNSTSNTKRAAFKVWDDETYASNDGDTNAVNTAAQAFINAVLADGSNTFNIIEGYDHTIFSIYNVNTNN